MSLDHELRAAGGPDEATLVRPVAQPTPSERAMAWVEWLGVARLATAALSVVLVCGGVFWLTRNPPPSTEASLPVAVAGSTPDTSPVTTPNAEPPVGSSPAPTVGATSEVVVHVMGEVREPGVYRLVAGDRVADAVAAAGGATSAAEVDRLNLAAPLRDGDRVQVPAVGDELAPNELVVAAPSAGAGVDATDSAGVADGGVVDVNRAGPDELQRLPGVGPATASAIVTERERGGPFSSLADLERVPGIGPAKLAALEGYVVV